VYAFAMSSTLSLTKSPKAREKMVEQFRALGDETRLALIMAVSSSENAEACVCDLTPDTGLAQSTVSHHLKMLVDAGLLTRTQRGKWAYYALTKDAQKILKN
jgi:ArsR family transcriptional regulator